MKILDKKYLNKYNINKMKGILRTQICRANLTRDVYLFQIMDPYFIASVSSNKVYTSSIKENQGKFPIWNEEFTFNTENGETELLIKILTNGEEVIHFSKIY